MTTEERLAAMGWPHLYAKGIGWPNTWRPTDVSVTEEAIQEAIDAYRRWEPVGDGGYCEKYTKQVWLDACLNAVRGGEVTKAEEEARAYNRIWGPGGEAGLKYNDRSPA